MSRLTRCNFCVLADLREFARNTGNREVELRPAPKLPEFPDGVDVYIGGAFSAWLAKIPTECHCNE